MEFDCEEKLTLEDSAHVDQAIDELSERNLPRVWIGDPEWDEYGNPVGATVDWLKLTHYVDKSLLSYVEQVQLYEEALHILAARRKLVTVKEVMPLKQAISSPKPLVFSVRNHIQREVRRFIVSEEDSLGSGFHEEDWIGEDTMIMFKSPPTSYCPLGSTTIIRFVDRDALLSSELPYISDFFDTALHCPCDVVVEATSELLFIADVLADVEGLNATP